MEQNSSMLLRTCCHSDLLVPCSAAVPVTLCTIYLMCLPARCMQQCGMSVRLSRKKLSCCALSSSWSTQKGASTAWCHEQRRQWALTTRRHPSFGPCSAWQDAAKCRSAAIASHNSLCADAYLPSSAPGPLVARLTALKSLFTCPVHPSELLLLFCGLIGEGDCREGATSLLGAATTSPTAVPGGLQHIIQF